MAKSVVVVALVLVELVSVPLVKSAVDPVSVFIAPVFALNPPANVLVP